MLRRNPQRAAEVAAGRQDTQGTLEQLVDTKNTYLRDHPQAQVAVALRQVQTRLVRFKIASWLRVEAEGRVLRLWVDKAAKSEAARLDGCYVLKTDLPPTVPAAKTPATLVCVDSAWVRI
jgi:hypothetical protein